MFPHPQLPVERVAKLDHWIRTHFRLRISSDQLALCLLSHLQMSLVLSDDWAVRRLVRPSTAPSDT